MSSIAQRVFVLGGSQPYMTLANEEFVRPLGIGNNWTKVRLGIMCALTPDSTNNIPTCVFALGLCSGRTAPFAAASTTNWTGATVSGTFSYTANTGNPYFSQLTNLSFGKRVGASTTVTAPGGVLQVASNTGTLQRRAVVYLDITKGSPNYTGIAYSVPIASTALDWSFAMFLDGMEQVSTPVLNTVTMTATTSQAYANSEVAGGYDTFDVYWSKSTFALDIYAMAVYRIQ